MMPPIKKSSESAPSRIISRGDEPVFVLGDVGVGVGVGVGLGVGVGVGVGALTVSCEVDWAWSAWLFEMTCTK